MRRHHRKNHDHVVRHHISEVNTTTEKLHNVFHQNGDGGGNKPGVMLDHISSALNDIKSHTTLTASRLSNIQDWIGTQDGSGGGTKAGVMLDQMDSSLNTIESNSTLTASRLNNIQNKLNQNTDGTGNTIGQMLHTASTQLTNFDDGSNNMSCNVVNTIFAGISGYENIGSSALTRILVNADGNVTTDNITTIFGSDNNLFSTTSCVAAGTFSSVIDWSAGKSPNRIQISLLATASVSATGFEVYGSHDGTDYARLQLPNGSFSGTLGNTDIASGSMNTSGGLVMDWGGHRYLKVKIYCLGTFNGTVTGLKF